MQVSCLPVSYFAPIIGGAMSVGEWARQARSIGLDAIDISILFVKQYTAEYLAALRREIQDSGLGLVMMTAYPDFTHPQAAERARQLQTFGEQIAVAAHLGARYVRMTAGQGHPQTPRQQGMEWAVDGMTGAQEIAQDNGIQLVFENHSKPGVWEFPDFCFPTDNFLELAGRMENTGVGINFDTANTVAYGDDPVPVLRRVLKQVLTIHAAETSTNNRKMTPCPLGTGLVPFLDIFYLLRENRWDGWICIEEASGMGRAGIEKAVQFVRSTWHQAGSVNTTRRDGEIRR